MAVLMVRATAQSMKHRAQIQDEGKWTVLVMLHSLVSFFLNVIIIAITVNVVAGVL